MAIKKVFLVLLVVLSITACDRFFPEQVSTAVPSTATQKQPTVVPATATHPTPTSIPAQVALTVNGGCSLEDGGVQLQLEQSGQEWIFDPTNPKVVLDYSGEHDVSELIGCNLIAEGRKVVIIEEHHIWVLRAGGKKVFFLDVDDDKFHCLECSVYAYPISWNMEDFRMTKPPIAAEFVTNKRLNMQQNVNTPYDWQIYVHKTDQSVLEYKPGETAGGAVISCENITEPMPLYVTGLIGNPPYNASVGATGCTTVAWLDDEKDPKVWQDAYDNLEFFKINAWLIPASWLKDQIDEWIVKQ